MEQYRPSNHYGEIKIDLPNATAVLVLGIISIFSCFCYGVIGLILSIIALVLANKDRQRYLLDPDTYSEVSYRNLMTGRTTAIIGLCLSGLLLLVILIAILVNVMPEIPWKGLT